VFGWFESKQAAERAGDAMAEAFKSVKLASDVFVSKVGAPGAKVLSR
jgi:hypothetical protein